MTMLERSLPQGFAILYALREPVDGIGLSRALRALSAWAGLEGGEWEGTALELRWREGIPWEKLVPQPSTDGPRDLSFWREVAATEPSIENIARVRGYPIFRSDGLRCCLDWLNPQNELMLPSNCIGEPTLALLFGEEDTHEARGSVRNRLAANEAWWTLVHRVAMLLPIVRVVGVHSVVFLLDFGRGRIDPRYSPSDFLFPVHLVSDKRGTLSAGMTLTTDGLNMLTRSMSLGCLDDWGPLGQLVVTRPGLDSVINSWEYWALGRLLGMTPIQSVLDGSVPPWPTALPR